VSDLPVHPLAAVFPMMDSDELAALADNIKENGLVHPIVLGEWVPDPEEPDKKIEGIIDGRNRLAGCELAKVKPRFERFDGKDIAAFIVANNINRRHLTKGQQAMALAFAHPEPEKGGRGNVGAVKQAKKLGGLAMNVCAKPARAWSTPRRWQWRCWRA
jgi:ParB-like nuclease family protein